MRSSGTPRDSRTSTARMAEPPIINVRKVGSIHVGSLLFTCGQHGIQEQNPSVGNVLWQLVVKQARPRRLLVSLDEDLADADGAAAVPQTALEALSGAHDRHAADLALELQSIVGMAYRGLDSGGDSREVVQAFLDQKTNDAVGVEDEVCTSRLLVADDAVGGARRHVLAVFSRLRRSKILDGKTDVRSAISCSWLATVIRSPS